MYVQKKDIISDIDMNMKEIRDCDIYSSSLSHFYMLEKKKKQNMCVCK